MLIERIFEEHTHDYNMLLIEEIGQIVEKTIEERLRVNSKSTRWVSIAEVQEATGWGRKRVELFRDQGKFRWQQLTKGGKYQYDLNDVLRFQNQMAK